MIPRMYYLTQKHTMSTAGLNATPPAFDLPYDAEKLDKFTGENPKAVMLAKGNSHGNVR